MRSSYEHRGSSYLQLLARLHEFLRPSAYLEVGTLNGETLKLSRCATICVDPFFQIASNPCGERSATMLFQTTSDNFFKRWNPTALLQSPLDLVFLDGLHEAETLLRDFSNVEKHCKRNSIICMHDCIPMSDEMTQRENTGGLWTGDVWKVIPILKEFRKDLQIHCFDAGPTGLVCCTNLNPSDRALDERAGEIWSEWRDVELDSYGLDRLVALSNIIWTEKVKTAEMMRKYFWL